MHFDKSEANAVRPIEGASRDLASSEATTAVEIVAPCFDEDNKWRVLSGEAPFWVLITDETFNATVRTDRRFGKSDYLVGTMRTKSEATAYGIRTIREFIGIDDLVQREFQQDML